MKKDVVALVLAGGIGKRFWPIHTNKSQIPFLGKLLLSHNLEYLRLTGITSVVIVISPQDKEHFANFSVEGLLLKFVIQKEATGMAGAVLAAENHLIDKSCFIMNAEDLVEEGLYRKLKNEIGGNSLVCVGRKSTIYFPGSYFILKDSRVVGVVEKPGEGNEPSNLVGLVFDYFPNMNQFIDLLKVTRSENDDVYERALNELLKNGGARILEYDGYWFPTKYPWHVLDILGQLLQLMEAHRGKNIEIKENVTIEGPVYIGDNVKIFENTKIVGPVYIGDNTIIGNNNIIRDSHIGANCVTGFNSDITRSYVGDNCWFHSNYIGDSILEGNISLGSGAVLANLRLDDGEIASVVNGNRVNTKRTKMGAVIGEGVRIGVNASIMPGVKIGKRSFVGAGVVLDKDLEDESFCIANTGYITTKNTRASASSKSRDAYKKYIG